MARRAVEHERQKMGDGEVWTMAEVTDIVQRRTAGFVLMTCLLVVIVTAVSFARTSFTFDVGEHQYAAFLENFRAGERAPAAAGGYSFQWTRPQARLLLPQVLTGDVWLLTLRIHQRGEGAPRMTQLTIGEQVLSLPHHAGSRIYRLTAVRAASLDFASDMRGVTDSELQSIGVALDTVSGRLLQRTGLPTGQLTPAAALISLVLTVTAHLLRLSRADTLLTFAGFLLFFLLLNLTAFPYLLRGLAGVPAVAAAVLGVMLLLRQLLRRLVPQYADAVSGPLLIWLFFGAVGVAYPGFTPTDIPFHVNRLHDALGGVLLQTAEGQGQTYPYPAGVYLALAPLAAACGEPRWCLQWAGLATVPLMLTAITIWLARHGFSPRMIRLHALLFPALPAAYLLQAQAPLAQNVAGLFALLFQLYLMTLLAQTDDAALPRAPDGGQLLTLSVLGLLVAVGHFGVLLNTLLMLALLALMSGQQRTTRRPIARTLLLTLAASALVVYSRVIPLMIEQLAYLTAAEGSAPSRWFLLWRLVLDLALFGHYRIVFVVCALLGWLWLWRRRAAIGAAERALLQVNTAVLLTSGLLIAALLAVFFNTTRYAIFAYPAISLFAASWLAQVERPGVRRLLIRLLPAVTFASSVLQWLSVAALHLRNGFLS